MFNSVEVVRPHKITIAMGVWISLPVLPPPSASGMRARPAAIAARSAPGTFWRCSTCDGV